MKKNTATSILQPVLGVFFIVLGVLGIIPGMQESVFSLNEYYPVEVIFGFVEVVCGLLLIAGTFITMKRKVISIAILATLAVWALRIFLTKFLWGIHIGNRGILFRPTFSEWLIVFTAEAVIGCAIFLLYKTYE